MTPEQLHVLLTYACNFECDHCFVYSGPEAQGTFTVAQLVDVLDQAQEVPSIEWIYFEGGEAFLYYPLLLEGVRQARARGYRVGIVTNSYWAATAEDAVLWLRPFAELEIEDLSVSDDAYHHGEVAETPAARAVLAARELGIPVGSITIEGAGGGLMFRGRAADRLTAGVPRRPTHTLTECLYEELEHATRLHVDPYGHLQVCQGISIGNVWEARLGAILAGYDAAAHPICGPLLSGGPVALATAYGVEPSHGCVDECHLCFATRRRLLERFPAELAPAQVYG